MPIIYQKDNQVVAHNPKDPEWKAWSVSDEYYHRLMAGERPASWDQLLLPDLPKFLDFATGSAEWMHISIYAPTYAGLLFTALTARPDIKQATIMANIRQFMTLINSTLATSGQALKDQLVDSVDENGDPIQITMSQQVDEWLSTCHFGFTMTDIGG